MSIFLLIIIGVAVVVGLIVWGVDGRFRIGASFAGAVGVILGILALLGGVLF